MDQQKYSFYIETLHNLDPENISSVTEMIMVYNEVSSLIEEISHLEIDSKEEEFYKTSIMRALRETLVLLHASCESSLIINEIFN